MLIAALFVGHGLVHGIMFGLPYSAKASADLPCNPSRSWLVGDTRSFAFVAALVVGSLHHSPSGPPIRSAS